VFLVLGAMVALALVLPSLSGTDEAERLDYTDLVARAQEGQVADAHVDNTTGRITGELRDGRKYVVSGPNPAVPDDLKLLRTKGVKLTFSTPQPSFIGSVLPLLLPIALLIGFWVFMSRRAQGQMSGLMSIGRSRAKIHTTERPQTTFAAA
jgi:cell division protease FtsH